MFWSNAVFNDVSFAIVDRLAQLLRKLDDVFVPRHVGHGERVGCARAAKCDAFDFNEIGRASAHKRSVLLDAVHVHFGDQRESEHCALRLARQVIDARHETLPKVFEDRPIDSAQVFLVRRVAADVELRDRHQTLNCFRELCVRHEERRNATLVQQLAKFVDFGIDNRLANKRLHCNQDKKYLLFFWGKRVWEMKDKIKIEQVDFFSKQKTKSWIQT